jgi:hypothetical protein
VLLAEYITSYRRNIGGAEAEIIIGHLLRWYDLYCVYPRFIQHNPTKIWVSDGISWFTDLPTSNQAWFALTLLCFIQIWKLTRQAVGLRYIYIIHISNVNVLVFGLVVSQDITRREVISLFVDVSFQQASQWWDWRYGSFGFLLPRVSETEEVASGIEHDLPMGFMVAFHCL